MRYWTIEVLNGLFSAQRWEDSHGDALVEAAHTNRVLDWQWTRHPWGVALELGFADEDNWLRFRALPAVQAALDAVPDVGAGLLIYPGRGGASGAQVQRKPRRPPNAGAATIPVPHQQTELTVDARLEPEPARAAAPA